MKIADVDEGWKSLSVDERAMIGYLEAEDAPAWAKEALKAVGEPGFKLRSGGIGVPTVPAALNTVRTLIDLLQTAIEGIEAAQRDERAIAGMLFDAARCMNGAAEELDAAVQVTFGEEG